MLMHIKKLSADILLVSGDAFFGITYVSVHVSFVEVFSYRLIVVRIGGHGERLCKKDCQARNLNRKDAMDRGRWKKLIKIG